MAITRVGGSWIHKYVSLVADDVTHTYTRAAKPELNLPNGSRCFEMDSDIEYIYDRENDAWEVYIPSSGGGGGSGGGAVSDVRINGNSILSNGIANVPLASNSAPGVAMTDADYGTEIANGRLRVVKAGDDQPKTGTHTSRPIVPANQHRAVFYGLAKAAGHDEKDSALSFGTYTDEAKAAIRNMLGAGTSDIDGVQIDGTSIVSNGVANIPKASLNNLGVIKVSPDWLGFATNNDGFLYIVYPSDSVIKLGVDGYRVATINKQHVATFYGLAKAAGDSTQSASNNAVGTYTEEAKNAIRAMLGVTDSAGGMNVVTLTGTNITQTAAENTMYKCGELAELTFTAPASGITAVRFSSGSTPTVASFPGVTWLGDFDPDNLIANVTYEINILDGVGVAGWA